LAIYTEGEMADLYTSILTVALFVVPIVSAYFFNWPKRGEK